ncbi:MAG: outer membrane beta-barrel protein [Burkholderiales bacterium]|nr:outer membrane beta-barrel protein [Burkholderiales bacterium]
MNKNLLVILCATSCISANASPYVDGNIGANTSENTLSINGNGGYMLNKYFGAEAGLTYSSKYLIFDGAAKGILPLNSQFSLFGKLGIAFTNYSGSSSSCGQYGGCSDATNSSSSLGVLIGVGAEYNLSKQISLHVEDYTTTGSNINFLMFGTQYNF